MRVLALLSALVFVIALIDGYNRCKPEKEKQHDLLQKPTQEANKQREGVYTKLNEYSNGVEFSNIEK